MLLRYIRILYAREDEKMRVNLIACFAVFVMVAALTGCQTNEQKVITPVVTEPTANEPAATAPTENGVIRVFSADEVDAGGTVDVKLYINLDPGQTYYIVDEAVPADFTVTGNKANKDNHIKLVEIQNAKSNVYEYSIQAPEEPGTYTFGGEYALEGMDKPVQIMGAAKITVR